METRVYKALWQPRNLILHYFRNVFFISGFIIAIVASCIGAAQGQTSSKVTAYVDKNGVIRWSGSNAEVHAFGVNYTVPFAYAYRAAKQLNVSLEKTIDDDVYHFARLGFDLYRVHVWDCEISDTVGNLLDNDHLRLLDYAIKKMKERGMKFMITPIAYWSDGYPDPPEKTPGFSTKYGKDNCLTNPDAIKAQEKYLFQFLNHVNRYTGVAYKEEPDLIAFEVCNEPHHHEAPEKVTEFINGMVKSMRSTGCKKPIFYNISHSIQLEDAYFKAAIQGGTFQWYPTGLVSRHEQKGNLLPNVDKYTIPFAANSKFKKIARIVYEFDAADVGRSYIYPAMARSFREAGMQIATQFAYDPTYTAYANTEYSTHYMNLAYAPQKALSLKIAGEVFHQIPMHKSFGSYPQNTSFDDFRVSYEKDLAEMTSENKFYYTNNTASIPPSQDKLEHIAGFGNSPVIQYAGSGAYFLDKLGPGVWRLEVMPDAIWVNDPFGRTSLKKEVSVINWRNWTMTVDLHDLGENYAITGLNTGNAFSGKAEGKTFTISPGTYFLIKKGTATKLTGEDHWNIITLKEFVAPPVTLKKTFVLHQPENEISMGMPHLIEAKVISVSEPESVELIVLAGFRPEVIKMEKRNGYSYTAGIPEKLLREGFLRYYICVKEKGIYSSYPSAVEGLPTDWDFYDENPYRVTVVPPTTPICLFDAMTDAEELSRQWNRDSHLLPTDIPGKAELQVNVEKLLASDPENKDAAKIYDYSMRYCFIHKLQGRKQDLSVAKKIVFHGRALNERPCKLQIALVMNDGSAYGGVIDVDPKKGNYELALANLKKVKLVSLPRPYPSFLDYYFESAAAGSLDMNAVETLQLSIGPGIAESDLQNKQGVGIESVSLEF